MIKTIIIIVGAFVLLGIISYTTAKVFYRQSPSAIPSPTQIATPANEQTAKVFFIALEDQGKNGTLIGCGDSVVSINNPIAQTAEPLKATVEKLVMRDAPEGLYTAFATSDLKVESAQIQNSKATVRLTGSLALGGVCDSPRVEAQLTHTIKQFSEVNEVEIYLNNQLLKDFLSEKG